MNYIKTTKPKKKSITDRPTDKVNYIVGTNWYRESSHFFNIVTDVLTDGVNYRVASQLKYEDSYA